MSFNHLSYDPCAYDKRLDESTSVLTYVLDPNKFYNCNECRIEFGVLGGNNVSRYIGNMVDLESDLRNQTRLASDCPSKKYIPGTVVQVKTNNGCKPGCGKSGLPCGSASCRKDPLKHLPACNIIDYGRRIDNIGYELNYPACPARGPKMERPKKEKKSKFSVHAWQGQVGILDPNGSGIQGTTLGNGK